MVANIGKGKGMMNLALRSTNTAADTTTAIVINNTTFHFYLYNAIYWK
jgi:hypothetical protein